MTLSNTFSESFRQVSIELSDEKIINDFWDFIDADRALVDAVTSKGEIRSVEISRTDCITLLAKVITNGHGQLIHVPLVIRVGIGEITFGSGVYKVSRCSAELLYNDFMELIDIDFYWDEVHQL